MQVTRLCNTENKTAETKGQLLIYAPDRHRVLFVRGTPALHLIGQKQIIDRFNELIIDFFLQLVSLLDSNQHTKCFFFFIKQMNVKLTAITTPNQVQSSTRPHPTNAELVFTLYRHTIPLFSTTTDHQSKIKLLSTSFCGIGFQRHSPLLSSAAGLQPSNYFFLRVSIMPIYNVNKNKKSKLINKTVCINLSVVV